MDRKRSLKRILAGVMALSMITGSTINDTGNYFLKMDNIAIVHAGDLAHFNPSVLSVKRHENGNVKSITIRYQWPYGNLYNAVVMTNKKIYHGNQEFSGYYGGKSRTSFDDSKKSIEWIGESGKETNTTVPIIKATEFYNVNGNDAKPHIIDKTFEFTDSELPITKDTELYFYMWTKNGSNVYYPDFQLATLKIQDGKVYYGWAENPASNALPNIVATIGDKKYDTLQEALEAAADGETVKIHGNLLGNFVFDSAGKAVTLDLNGYGLMTNSGTALKVNAGKLTITDSNAESEHKFTVDGNNLAHVDDSLTENYKTFKGGFITGGNNTSGPGGGVLVQGDGTELTLEAGTILGNKTSQWGGGIYCKNKSVVNMTGGTIMYNDAHDGGGLGVEAEFNMSGGSIENNRSLTNGGGIILNDTMNMSGGVIKNNTVTNGNGGGIYCYKNLNMTGGVIQDNTASRCGGGVGLASGYNAVFELSSGTIQGNKANNGGGVSCEKNTKMNMTGGVIQYNEGTGNTAGILLDNTNNFTMSGGTVQYNAGLNYGGIGTYNSTPHLSGKINITNNVINNPTTGMIIKGDDGKYSLKEGGTPCDIRQANQLTDINGKIDKGSKIGVFRSTNVFTTNFKANNEEDPAVSAFFSNDSNYAIRQNADGELMFDINLELIGEKTYAISNNEEYALFANYVNAGNDCTGLTFVLTNDIQTSKKVGVVEYTEQRKPFSGTFDGAGHTLNVDISDDSNQGTAPFCYINNAVIKNVRVTGTVKSKQHHAAGLVGFTGFHGKTGPKNLIENCIVSTTVNGGDYAGGVVGHALSTNVTYDGCVFDGIINGNNNATLGAIQGWADKNSISTVNNCLYIIHEGQATKNLSFVEVATFGGKATVTGSYKTVATKDTNASLSHTIECSKGISLDPGENKKSFKYDGIKVYENAVQYKGKIYGAEGKTFNLKGDKPTRLFLNKDEIEIGEDAMSFVMPSVDTRITAVTISTPALTYTGEPQKFVDADKSVVPEGITVSYSTVDPDSVKSTRIQCENWDEVHGEAHNAYSGLEKDGKANTQINISDAAGADGGVVGYIKAGNYTRYNKVDFGNSSNGGDISLRYSVAQTEKVKASLWIDGPNEEAEGKKICEFSLTKTGSWTKYGIASARVSDVTGKHDVYLVFDETGLNVDYLEFTPSIWSDDIPSETNAGNYKFWYKIDSKSNVVNPVTYLVDTAISPAALKITGASASKPYDTKPFEFSDFTFEGADSEKLNAVLNEEKTVKILEFGTNEEKDDGKSRGAHKANIKITNPNYVDIDLSGEAVKATITETDPVYTVPDSRSATYGQKLSDISLPTAENGKWAWAEPAETTVGNAGTNSFKAIFAPADANYNTVQKDVSVEVAKANVTITEAPSAADIVYEQSLADSKLTGGTVMFGETPVKGTFAWKAGTVKPSVADSGKTKYTVVFTPEDNKNFNTAECEITLAIAKATPDYTEPKDLATTYGKTLEDVILSEAENGKWAWAEPAASVGNAGTNSFKAVFTPTDTNYNTVQKDVSVEVAKANVTITEAPSAADIVYEQSLADSKLTGGTVLFGETSVKGTFTWKDGTVKPSVADGGKTKYAVVFTPDDNKNFNAAACEITLAVAKAEPKYAIPEGLKITYGKTLKDVSLLEGWTWNSDADTKLEKLGDNVYKATFTPKDTANYNTVTKDLTILVYVDKTALKKAISDTEAYTKKFDEEYHTRIFKDLNKALKNGKNVDESLTVTQDQIDTATADLEEALDYAKKLVNEINHVQGLIDAIGAISYTDECKAKIDAAREAYDALLFNQQMLVKNYKVLVDAESEYEKLGIEKYRIIKVSGKAATHTESGLKTYWKQDGLNYEDDKCTKKIDNLETWIVIPAEGHNWGEWVTKVPATCTESGLAVRTCEDDGATETKVIPATGEHKYGKPVYTWSEDGKSCTAKAVCETDKKITVTETAEVTSAVKTAATCDKAGVTTYTAKFKNELFSDQTKDVEDVPATGHKYGKPVYTWSEDGKSCTATVICETDKKFTVTETVEVTSAVKIAATCDKAGVTTYTATFKNELFSAQTKDVEDIPATGHKFGEWTVTKEATEEADGCETRICEHCGKEETNVILATVHKMGEWKIKKAATCLEDGIEERACADCDKTETRVIKAAGEHKFGEWTVAKKATCEETGLEVRKCENCGEEETRVIPATGHKFSEWKTVTKLTDEVDGLEVRTCEHCGREEARATLATGHEFGEWKVTEEPTCEKSGIETRYCDHNDGTFETREIPAIGHKYGAPVYTWSDDGKTCTATVTCEHDKTHVITEKAVITSTVKAAATCDEAGVTTYTATFKNELFSAQTKDVEDIPATGHKFGAPVYTWSADGSTCTAIAICETDKKFTVTEEAVITSAVKTAATCDKAGVTTYTALFKNELFSSQTKDVEDIPAAGHKYGTPVYTWSEDGKTCTATVTCEHDKTHAVTETAVITGAVKTAATCDKAGVTTYTATFKNELFSVQTKDVADIPATGEHRFGGWHVTITANAEHDGTKEHKCEVCGLTETASTSYDYHESADEVTDSENKPGEIRNITEPETNACSGTIEVTDKKEILDTFPLTNEECDQVENGKDIGLKLEVTDISENEGVKEKADEAVKDTVGEKGVVAAVLDVSIHKYIDGHDAGRVTQLNKVLRVYIDLPAGLYKEGRTFYVVREHEGKYEALPLTLVSETRAYFESDQYSQFYIVYTEAHEHEFGEWKTSQNASWLHRGYEERTCECGEKETRRVEESWTEWLVGAVGRRLRNLFH